VYVPNAIVEHRYSHSAGRAGAGFRAPRPYSRGVLRELAGGGAGVADSIAMAESLKRITALRGVSDAPLAFLMTAGAVFLIVLYRLSLMISHLKDSNIALVQRLAILEFRLECLDGKTKAVSQS
jgi:hypothetical protein